MIEQFLFWLKDEEGKAPDITGNSDDEAVWYLIGYQDAMARVQNMYRLAFKDEL